MFIFNDLADKWTFACLALDGEDCRAMFDRGGAFWCTVTGMPSPVGHALGGVIVGLLSGIRQREKAVLAILVVAANGADLDFLWGRHGAETHSIGAAILAGFLTLVLSRGHVRLAVAVAAAWASHVLFDWLGSDDTAPIGVMALWPFSDAYYFANAYVFEAISRRYWLPNFWTHNVMAVLREIALLVPIVALLVWIRVRRGRS